MDDISLSPFKFKHQGKLLEMHASNEYEHLSALDYSMLPKIGYIAYKGEMPIAAGFLRRLEPCFAHIDTLVSNKYCGKLLRHRGISLVVDALLQDAKRLKLKGIIAHSSDEGTISRAKSLGFCLSKDSILVLPIGDSVNG